MQLANDRRWAIILNSKLVRNASGDVLIFRTRKTGRQYRDKKYGWMRKANMLLPKVEKININYGLEL